MKITSWLTGSSVSSRIEVENVVIADGDSVGSSGDFDGNGNGGKDSSAIPVGEAVRMDEFTIVEGTVVTREEDAVGCDDAGDTLPDDNHVGYNDSEGVNGLFEDDVDNLVG